MGEENNKEVPETEKTETDQIVEETKDRVDQAAEIAKSLKEELDRKEELLRREEALQSRRELSGKSEAGFYTREKTQEEKDQEQIDAILNDE